MTSNDEGRRLPMQDCDCFGISWAALQQTGCDLPGDQASTLSTNAMEANASRS